MFVQKISKNEAGRDFVVGDIHGAFDLLEEGLRRVSFDTRVDRLISVGDLINRGSRSQDCLSFLQQSWFHAVQGNHERMFMDLFEEEEIDWEMLDYSTYSFMGWMKNTDEKKLHEINEVFKRLPIAIEVQTDSGDVGIVHAEIPKGISWNKFKTLIETKNKNIVKHALSGRNRVLGEDKDSRHVWGISRVFHGHTVHASATVLGNRIYIDTGAVKFNLASSGVEKSSSSGLTILKITAPVEMMREPQFKEGVCAIL